MRKILLSLLAGSLSLLSLLLTGCSSVPISLGDLGGLESVAASCPANHQVASFVADDGSGSSADPGISKQRLSVIGEVVRSTVVCGGHLTVVGFANSSGSNVTVYDGSFSLPGATRIAQVRVAGPVIARTMKAITKAYASAMASLPANGSDIVAEYRLAAENQHALGAGYQLNVVLLTDGLQNIGFSLEGAAMSPAAATTLAKTIPVPTLRGASITVAGLGKIAGAAPAPSAQVAGLVAFYTALCHDTHAAKCLSVTTLPAGW